ncbi:MAG: hypothetical protein NC299_05600 [Lachnospiraceae bacterium]|nr:hypothetical protein [Ruminococcus sp.]MCM1274825.1 hypothetical protein [Lachnospiraceae bacterium]
MKLKIAIAALFAALVTAMPTAARAAELSALPEKYLTEQELELYRETLKNVVSVAEGKRSAEAFYITVSKPFPTKKAYEDAIEKVMFFIDNYTPEYSFWTDSRGYLVYDTARCGLIYGISPAYQQSGNEKRMDAARLNDAKKALANAQAIVDKYEGKSDYEKVVGYTDEICALNEYNYDALFAENIDPWSIVYVFDNDPSTNVVCAGYARAFQYLCALGGIECHYVTGSIDGESHAWNIAVLDGESYFADLTACDGFPESDIKRYHPFVLGNVASNAQDGFSTYFMYSGSLFSDMNTYKYGKEEMQYLPESLRTLSTKPLRKGGFHLELWHIPLIALIVGVVIRCIKRRKASLDSSGDY